MSKFIGRQRELRSLEEACKSKQSAFVPIYGRRRVGKSELIRHFLKGKSNIFIVGKRAQATLQIKEFLQEAAVTLGEPLLAETTITDWRAALAAVMSRWKCGGKRVLVFDEFQWLVEKSPELPSVLQALWDHEWSRSGDVMLILCGSYVGFMEREVLGRKSPLFGRHTGQILLRPFGYREAASFHPSYSTVDHARTYFVCGGIPLYLNCFSLDRSVEANIADVLLDEYGPLYREPDFLLREELREVENYYAILFAMASRSLSHKEISQKTGIDSRALHYYFKQLMELGYLSKRNPLTSGSPSTRKTRYAIDDPLLRFWFRFIYQNVSFILQMGGRSAFRERIRPGLDSYFGLCFERMCREALPFLYECEGLSASFEIGEYWDKDTQIDVVGLRGDNWIDVGECKWGAVRSVGALAREIDAKVGAYPNPKNATVARHIFTRKRVTLRDRAEDGISWHCLDDLYSA